MPNRKEGGKGGGGQRGGVRTNRGRRGWKIENLIAGVGWTIEEAEVF